MVGVRIVTHNALDVGMNEHAVAASTASRVNLEPRVVLLEHSDDVAVFAPAHGTSSDGLLERASGGFRQPDVAHAVVGPA